jgi:acyl-CoA thioester hydrolase
MTAHRFAVRVYYEDTDAGGIVYHAQYLCFAERARTELLRTVGVDHGQLLQEEGGVFAVRRALVEFHRPARLDDLLVVETSLKGARGARLDLRQEIKRDVQTLVTIDIDLAFITPDLRPRRLPACVKAGFAAMASFSSADA